MEGFTIRIKDVEFIGLRYPLDKPIPFSLGAITHRQFAFIRIQTSEGITGIGETSVNFPSWSLEERRATVEHGIRPLLLGENPLDIERLWKKMHDNLIRLGLQWGGKGPIYQAISGADQALWDILGKVTNQPVYKLLGGTSEPIALYATGLNTETLIDSVQEVISKGYKGIKLRVGIKGKEDLKHVKDISDFIGEQHAMYVDANQGLNLEDALAYSLELQEVIGQKGWLEEPVRIDDHEGIHYIRQKTGVRLAGGENAFGKEDFFRLLTNKEYDVYMPDVTRTGGLTEARKICSLLDLFGVPYSPHHYGSDVGFMATLHLIASAPGCEIMMRDVSATPLREEVLINQVEIKNGFAYVPTAPGLGIEINDEAINNYRV